MFSLCTMFRRLPAITLMALLAMGLMRAPRAEGEPLHIDLAVSFEPTQALLRGTARLTLPAGERLTLDLSGLTITAATLSRADREHLPLPIDHDVISLLPDAHSRTLFVSYEKRGADGSENSITPDAIVLTSAWHPIPNHRATYSLSAQVPAGFTAISESDVLTKTAPDGSVRFSFSQPLYGLNFAAAPYIEQERIVRPGLRVRTLFLADEQSLAQAYLDSATAFISRYEQRIGPYPYNHYVIVENIKPTGLALPTFTLLGRQVLRLPFIRTTSLGHEILHSWFGNSIDIREGSGNWCEGLTTYLADMAYERDAGEAVAAASRKRTIQSYLSYVKPSTPPLKDFIGGTSHDRVFDRSARSVGYGKAAMLFHEVRERIGPESFAQAIRDFYRRFKGTSASWADLEKCFEEASAQDLTTFFQQRLNHNTLPELTVDNLTLSQGAQKTTLEFTITQQQTPTFELLAPIAIKTVSGTTRVTRLISNAVTDISLHLEATPLELSIDPEHDVMRSLSRSERAPVWSDLLGADDCVVILADEEQRSVYEPFLQSIRRVPWTVVTGAEFTFEAYKNRSLIFLGTASPLSRGLFAQPDYPNSGFTLDVRTDPLEQERRIALISSADSAETSAVVHRLDHYGSYSYLHFEDGMLTEKRIAPTADGINIQVEQEPKGIALNRFENFEQLVDKLAALRVIYIGETHTSRADHLLQTMLIEALNTRRQNLVVGMEMFPRSSQPALERYINDPRFSESAFLRLSRYYDVWNFDYRLFRPIFAIAKKNRIPVIGLNLEQELVSSVFRKGSIADLPVAVRESLPVDRDLDLPGYRERLAVFHKMHGRAEHAEGALSGFIEAQALWDETMAETIADYLSQHPTASMVVLAGNQHTRKDSGIPPRVARRLAVSQGVVTNLSGNAFAYRELQHTSDYLFFLEADDLPPAGKIGVVLTQNTQADEAGLIITEITPEAHAAAAGIKVDDRLVSIADVKTQTMTDVRIALLGRLVGESLPIVVERSDHDGSIKRLHLEVSLFAPTHGARHR